MKRGVDYIGVGVGALILDDEGKVFLARRGPQAKNERGKWECPGGAVEFGETCAESLRREIREEHDIEIEVLELLQLCDHIIPEEQQHWVAPTYACRIVSGGAKNNGAREVRCNGVVCSRRGIATPACHHYARRHSAPARAARFNLVSLSTRRAVWRAWIWEGNGSRLIVLGHL